MYKNNLKKQEPWKKNFTLVTDKWTFGADPTKRPFWVCKDPTGKCQGNSRSPQSFPAMTHRRVKSETRGFDGEIRYRLESTWDENAGPTIFAGYDDDGCEIMEPMIECPYCRRYRDGSTE